MSAMSHVTLLGGNEEKSKEGEMGLIYADLDVVLNPLKQTIEVNPDSPYMGKTIVK